MKQLFFGNGLFLRFCVAVLTVSVVVLPLTPVISVAAETKAVSEKVEKVDTSKAVVLDDAKKAAVINPQEVATTGGSGVVQGGEKLTPEPTNNSSVVKTENIPPKSPVQAQPAQQPEEGLSTLAKVGIGVGAVAVVGGIVALASGGGGNGSGGSVSCSDLAGGYYGRFVDNCPGYNVSGEMLISLKSTCAFSGSSSLGVSNSGSFTDRSGSSLVGAGNTSSNGCGNFSINCETGGGNINCGFTYSSGRGGSFNGRLQ